MADPLQKRCTCGQCRVRRLTGPLLVITVGVIFLLEQFTHYGIRTLWPLLLIVPGVVLVAASFASDAGHIGT
jgi:Domain of unknown function (DUF5668)